MILHTVDIRAVSNTVGGVTTILGILAYNGSPARTFYYGQQVPTGADAGAEANIERQVITRVTDQFVLWVQNGKPNV